MSLTEVVWSPRQHVSAGPARLGLGAGDAHAARRRRPAAAGRGVVPDRAHQVPRAAAALAVRAGRRARGRLQHDTLHARAGTCRC